MITNKLLAYVAGTILLGAAFPMAFASAATYSPSMANGGTTSSASNGNSLVPAMTPGNTTTSGTMNETHKNFADLFSAFSRNIIVGTISGSIGSDKQKPDWILGGNFVLTFKSNSTTGTASLNGTGLDMSTDNTTGQNNYSGQAMIGDSGLNTNPAGSNTNSSDQNSYAGQAMIGRSGSTNLNGSNNNSSGNTTTANNYSFNESRLASLFPDVSASQITNVTGLYGLVVMVKPDGSQLHTHLISNFSQTENATVNGNITTINGTSTMTMKGTPVNDVPTSINISTNNGTVVAISFDKPSISRHFDNSSIYGIAVTRALMDSMIKENSMMTGTSTSSITNGGPISSQRDTNNLTTFEEEAMKGTP